MNIGSTTGSAFMASGSAVVQATDQVYRAAQDVVDATTARPVEGAGDISSAMTDLKQGQQAVDANVKVLQAQNEALGSLLNTKA